MGKLKLTVNQQKTRICRVPEESFDFLGYTPRPFVIRLVSADEILLCVDDDVISAGRARRACFRLSRDCSDHVRAKVLLPTAPAAHPPRQSLRPACGFVNLSCELNSPFETRFKDPEALQLKAFTENRWRISE